MAASREPRCNAGNRMSRVLEEELEEDDFYKTTYGGFAEEEEDEDFAHDKEDSADEVDSDFDRSEDDEIKSEEEDVDRPRPRKRGIVTKAYKEPLSKKTAKTIASSSTSGTPGVTEKKTVKRTQEPVFDTPMRKSSRKSTASNSLMTIMRQKEREESDKKKKEAGKKPVTGVRRLTQEELMKLAEKTEKKNLKSLEKYQRLEANRKKVSFKRKTIEGPTVTFLSTVVPTDEAYDDKNVDSKADSNRSFDPNKMSQNFLIFSHDKTFDKTFYHKRRRTPLKPYCPVTKKAARYVDPLTKIPYYDLSAFKIIREIYRNTVKEMKSK